MLALKDIFGKDLYVGDTVVWGYAGQGSSLAHGEIIDIAEEDEPCDYDYTTRTYTNTRKVYNLRVNDGHARRWLGTYRNVVKVQP